ncbi:MAG: peptide deformylase [Myxococcota bacterium]
MAILKVARMGHPVLRLEAQPVRPEDIATAGFQRFCNDLLETMIEYDGAGLAAPQVHVPLRVAVLTLDGEDEPRFFVNPEVTPLGEGTARTWEGCLSVPGFRGLVERPDKVRVRALMRDGSEYDEVLEGFSAVVVQHEFDHLDGVLYVDRVLPRSLLFLEEYRRWGPPEEYAEVEAYEDEEGFIDDDDDDEEDTVPSASVTEA